MACDVDSSSEASGCSSGSEGGLRQKDAFDGPPGPGPRTFVDIVRWCETAMGRAQLLLTTFEKSWSEVRARWADHTDEPRLALTTHFSGLGTAEVAMSQVIQCLETITGEKVPLLAWAATDEDKVCSSILCNHVGSHAPRCVFEDILDRIPAARLRQLQALQGRYLEKYQAEALRVHASKKAAALKTHSSDFMKEVQAILKLAPLNRDLEAYCAKHKSVCRVAPPATLGGRRLLWWDISGVICRPFSKMGKQLGWLDTNALPTIIHLHQLVQLGVDVAIVECTPRLDICTIKDRILTDDFLIEPVTFCTTDLGIPARRLRMYAKITNLRTVRRALDFSLTFMSSTFFSSVVADPTLFFQASDTEVAAEMNEIAAARSIPPHVKGKAWESRSALLVAARSRLEQFEREWKANRAKTGEHDAHFYASISQTSDHGAKLMRHIPTLVRNSLIWGEKEGRCMLAREHLGVHGLPLFLVDDDLFKTCAIRWLLVGPSDFDNIVADCGGKGVAISATSLRKLSGNQMSLPAVGVSIIFAMITSRPI